MLPMFLGLDWGMIKIFAAIPLYFFAIGWMSNLTGSKFMGIILASILIYIAWVNEFALYFIFFLFFFNALLGQLYQLFHVPLTPE